MDIKKDTTSIRGLVLETIQNINQNFSDCEAMLKPHQILLRQVEFLTTNTTITLVNELDLANTVFSYLKLPNNNKHFNLFRQPIDTFLKILSDVSLFIFKRILSYIKQACRENNTAELEYIILNIQNHCSHEYNHIRLKRTLTECWTEAIDKNRKPILYSLLKISYSKLSDIDYQSQSLKNIPMHFIPINKYINKPYAIKSQKQHCHLDGINSASIPILVAMYKADTYLIKLLLEYKNYIVHPRIFIHPQMRYYYLEKFAWPTIKEFLQISNTLLIIDDIRNMLLHNLTNLYYKDRYPNFEKIVIPNTPLKKLSEYAEEVYDNYIYKGIS